LPSLDLRRRMERARESKREQRSWGVEREREREREIPR
jgi:hypothetical protein